LVATPISSHKIWYNKSIHDDAATLYSKKKIYP
jgi:hypothetical protein